MDNILKLLKGCSVFIGDIEVKQHTLEKLIELGFEECQRLLLITVLEPKDLLPKDLVNKETLDEIDLYDIICILPNLNDWYKTMLNFFVAGEWEYDSLLSEYVCYTFEQPLVINKKNFKEVTHAVRTAYCMTKGKSEFDAEKATSDEVAKMLEEFAQVKKQQEKNKPKITIDSIVESVVVKHSGYNFFNIWDLTLYQLMKTYYRIEHIENYENVMRSIYAGVMSSKDIKLEEIYWANKASD